MPDSAPLPSHDEHPPRLWAQFAREVIETAVRGGDAECVPSAELPSCGHGGVFVTPHRGGRLRGCMGLLDPAMPLVAAVRQAAVCAALQDPRFSPVSTAELGDLKIEVSILSEPRPLGPRDADRAALLEHLELGVHGILVRRGRGRGLFLPQVATEHQLSKEEFLSRCCEEKAVLAPDAWRDPATEVLVFTTEVFEE
jgi:AmmeMemoRadiSam system protein A